MSKRDGNKRPEEPERVVIRDNRRIDPETGAVRQPAGGTDQSVPPEAAGVSDEVFGEADVQAVPDNADGLLLEERTRDLQRVQAEYANYRKRAERDRLAAGDLAVSRVLADLVPVLDDLDRARKHGDLTGGLKAVADQLDSVFGKLGLVQFGEVGDPFDPVIHEAVMHDESRDVSEPTCTTVLRPGYRHNDRLVRAAMVGVTDPMGPADDTTDDAPLDVEVVAGSDEPANDE